MRLALNERSGEDLVVVDSTTGLRALAAEGEVGAAAGGIVWCPSGRDDAAGQACHRGDDRQPASGPPSTLPGNTAHLCLREHRDDRAPGGVSLGSVPVPVPVR
jgi:hypothetical protein